MAMMVIGRRCATSSASRGSRWVNFVNWGGAVHAGATCACALWSGACRPENSAASANAPAAAQMSGTRAMLARLRGRRGMLDRFGNEPGEELSDAVVDPLGGVGVLARVI